MRLVELGQITEEDIYMHPQRNAVLRSLGDNTDLEVDLFEEHLRPGDALLLCSDGQWEMTHNPEIEQILERFADADEQQVCQELINAANQAGGEDNITSILVRFEAI
jgi:protein phosphatase